MTWTKAEETELRRLCKDKSIFATEIAALLRRDVKTVSYKMRKLGFSPRARSIKTGRMGQWNCKHAHLRKAVLTFYQSHSLEETRKHFKLTTSEIKSLFTVAYRMPEFSHLRKDDRRKDAWTFNETRVLLQCSGLQPRVWIAKKLKRGGVHSVKEMVSRLRSNTRYINGLPKRLACEIVGKEIEGFKVKAGPSGRGVDGRPIIVPWVVIYSEAKKSRKVPEHILGALRAMSTLQKRVHKTRGINDTVARIKQIIGGRL